jgi:hypothetical protein
MTHTKRGKIMNLYTEARAIAQECLTNAEGDADTARDYIHADCDRHAVSIYYGRAIDFCATQDTTAGEEWLHDVGGIVQQGDSFGQIACRIAFATLYLATCEALDELIAEQEEAAA